MGFVATGAGKAKEAADRLALPDDGQGTGGAAAPPPPAA